MNPDPLEIGDRVQTLRWPFGVGVITAKKMRGKSKKNGTFGRKVMHYRVRLDTPAIHKGVHYNNGLYLPVEVKKIEKK